MAGASCSTASSATAVTPPTAASALATRGAVMRDVPVEATVVAATRADPVSPALLPYGEVLHLAAVLEQVVTVGVKVAPRIFLPLRVGGRLGLLRERLGDENAFVGSMVSFLAFGECDLVFGFILPGNLIPSSPGAQWSASSQSSRVVSMRWVLSFSRILVFQTLTWKY